MSVSTIAPTAEIAVSSTSYSIAVEVPKHSITVNATGPAGPSGSRSRTTTDISTGLLAPSGGYAATALMATGYCLYHIQTTHPCRTRLYTSLAKRDADVTRPIGTYPPQDSGLIFEFVSTPALLQAPLAPPPMGFLHPLTATPAVPFTINNLHTASAAIAVTLTWVEMEF